MKSVILAFSLFLLSFQSSSNGNVFVCDSTTSYAYHRTENCRGLNRCSHQIIQITESEAQNRGKRACKICFN